MSDISEDLASERGSVFHLDKTLYEKMFREYLKKLNPVSQTKEA